ncbi:hypothetical protein COO03_04750 [Bacillus sp. AFS098217]|uniref:hypothetical protein n=1 Tax=Bacillus sp. AFS098217 TaxID=2033868 RepID=UPI000BEC5C46|nr:hypothetical protein [Bacillus sp. AFS098217]PEB54553.1 hypothetical protein COO03_04750 [Bacillus sp. AFS098217]
MELIEKQNFYETADNPRVEQMLEKYKPTVCPKCHKKTLKSLYNDEHPLWIKECSCCKYREVNSKYSPFVYV